MSEPDLNSVLNEGSIIDNQRTVGPNKITLKKILQIMSTNADGMKCSVGYFYLEGLALIIDSLKNLSEIKILMGLETTALTKEQLIKTLEDDINLIQDTYQNISAVTNFHKLVSEAKTLQVRAFFGTNQKPERLHSKVYIFLRDVKSSALLERYYAGIVGSSNLTPSGLVANTELNVIIDRAKDLQYLENWFDNLWQISSEDFHKLKISHALSLAIEKSKFGEAIKKTFIYVKPEEFFKILIKYMNADYLFEDWKESGLMGFQQVDSIRCLRLFNEKNYRGVFLTSSVGLGKSYVACHCAKYFLRESKKVLLIAPSGLIENEEHWPRYLREFKIFMNIDILSMGILQKDPIVFEQIDLLRYSNQYSLIIVDEAHNYRNQDAYRTRNLKKIIDKNGDSKILFLTATPINTNFDDLISLIKLFYRQGNNIYFDKLYRGLLEISSIISNKSYDKWSYKEKEAISITQESLERELFVKSTRETIKTSPVYLEEIKAFTGIDISSVHDPDVYEIEYVLDRKYKDIINGIIEFISNFTAANFRIFDPEKGAKLGGIFKWVLYKRFESDISSYYLTLKRMYKRNTIILDAINKKDPSILKDQSMQEDEIEIRFDFDYIEKMADVISKIQSGEVQKYSRILDDLKKDTQLIRYQIDKLEVFLPSTSKLLFKDDKKLFRLQEQIKNNLPHKILIFTEYTDTLHTIREFFQSYLNVENIEYIESATKNKSKIINRFNNDRKLRLLVATDSISEGFNISGADIIINFDIPYNPVRIIQRIGRATRLDNPKPLKVLNFKPSDDIDKELDLLERLQIRIEDIIRFVGIEYRVWFEREKDLLVERRKKDVLNYLEILKSLKNDLWKGRFDRLEAPITYTRPLLMLMQNAILKYKIQKHDIVDKYILYNTYTTLRGEKRLSLFYDNAKSYNENSVPTEIEESHQKVNFEQYFFSDLEQFRKHLEKEKQEEIVLSYYSSDIDKRIRNIIEIISNEGYFQIYPSTARLIKSLKEAKHKCGASTPQLIKELLINLKRDVTDKLFQEYSERIERSFTNRLIQKTLEVEERKPFLALALID